MAQDTTAAGILSNILRQNNVYLGGSALGKGFRRAARYHLQTHGEEEESFYVVDIGVVVSQYYQWLQHFPRVSCYYAVKCNPDPLLIQTLAALGANFDCASQQEIRLVEQLTSHLPQKPEILYANPCKARSHIRNAVFSHGVTLMTFDNVEEVRKCASVSTDIKLILRIVTDDSGSQCRLSTKYGAPRLKWRELLQAALDCELQVVGISFHVGSGCRDGEKYQLALQDVKELYDLAITEYGFDIHIIDIGGGFPGETHSLWNPAARDAAPEQAFDVDDENEEKKGELVQDQPGSNRFMFFDEIASQVSPMLGTLKAKALV